MDGQQLRYNYPSALLYFLPHSNSLSLSLSFLSVSLTFVPCNLQHPTKLPIRIIVWRHSEAQCGKDTLDTHFSYLELSWYDRCVYMCIYRYTDIYIYISVNLYICMYIYTHMYMYIYIYVYLYICVYIYIHT